MTDQQPKAELKTLYQITGNVADINTIPVNQGELSSLRADLERVSMQLVACGVVAMSDTPGSAKKARAMHPDYESASCDDVKRRVDECIALRARVAELEDVLTNLPLSSPQRMRARIQRLEEMLAAVGAGGVGPLMPPVAERPGVLMPSRSLVDQVIRELARYCNTGEMDDAESLLAGLQLSIDPAQQPPTTEQSSVVEQPQGEQEPVAWWRPVVGFEGLYEVSPNGDILNIKTNAMLAKSKMGVGYIKADLWKLGTRTQTSVHRVVAEAFIGSIDGLEVNHINGDKTDNRVVNLEIVTKAENERHSRSILGNLVKPVVAKSLNDGSEIEFESIESTAQAGFLPSSVYKCCYGICKKHKGYEFRFKNPEHANGRKVVIANHPQPKREPLTVEQIAAATGAKPGTPMWLVAVAFTRAIEAAQGIGGEA